MKKKEIGRKINIVNYNPEWNELFIKEKNKLERIFGDLVCSIHHVGSTAIKTSKAKPEIDILIVVNDDSNLSEYDMQMIDLGYRARGGCLKQSRKWKMGSNLHNSQSRCNRRSTRKYRTFISGSYIFFCRRHRNMFTAVYSIPPSNSPIAR